MLTSFQWLLGDSRLLSAKREDIKRLFSAKGTSAMQGQHDIIRFCVLFQVDTFKISKEKLLLILPRIPWLVAPSCFTHRWRKKRKDSQSDSNGKGRESFDSSSCITVRSVEATVRTEIYASASSMMDVSLHDC